MADRGRYVQLDWPGDFSRAGRKQSRASRYKAFIPAAVADDEPTLKSATGALCERAAIAVRDLNSDISGLVSLEGMGRQLLRSEALASSQIEGLSISHRKLAEAELEGRQGHHRALEILGTIRALERATEIGAESGDITLEAVTQIHEELALVPLLDKIAGQIREEVSWIGGTAPPNAEYVGPPQGKVRPLLDDLCEFMNRDDISPIPQAAIAHAQFELIHPFGDGNGRVGRCLIHVLFRRREVAPRYVPPISLVLGADKDAYIAGLQAFRAGKTDQWIAQFARAVETAAVRARTFSAEVAELQDRWRGQIGSVRSDAAVLRLIDLLPRYPIVTAAVAEKQIGRSRPATISGLAQLEDIGALTRRRNQKKGDSWEAGDLFRLLDSFESSVQEA
jgi:Fic family protein